MLVVDRRDGCHLQDRDSRCGGQLANPMKIMLLIVGVASFAIGQIATGFVVTALVAFNVIMATNQELKARASVEAPAQLQVPRAALDGPVTTKKSSRTGWCREMWCCWRPGISTPSTSSWPRAMTSLIGSAAACCWAHISLPAKGRPM